MASKKNDAKGNLATERSKKLKELAIEELRTMTYHSPEEEFDPERTHALVKVISKEEFIPDAYKGDAFYKRFQALHSDLFTDDKIKNKEYKEEEPELEEKVIQNQDLDKEIERKLLQSRELDTELERKANLLKNLDQQTSQKSKSNHKKLLRFAMVACVLLAVFGTVNIVTYASGKSSVFEVVEQVVNYIKTKATGSEYVPNHDNTDNHVKYQIGIERNILDIVDYSEVSKYFNRTIYLPSRLPEIIVTGDVTYVEWDGNFKTYINYNSEDQKEYLLIKLCEANRGEEDSDTAFFEGSIYSEYRIRIANSSEILCAYESEEYNVAYLIFNDIFYLFKYNLTTEQVINIIETMEAY